MIYKYFVSWVKMVGAAKLYLFLNVIITISTVLPPIRAPCHLLSLGKPQDPAV